MKEKDCEIILWEWLKNSQNVLEVYFNRKNEINAKTFRVSGESIEIPDLLIKCVLFGKPEYIAIEVKNGEEGINVIKSNKILNIYYDNYLNGKTKYLLENKEIPISKFLVATQFSKLGKLFQKNEGIVKNGKGFENESWVNKNVPLNEYSRTKDFLRMLLHDFSEYRKKNKIKESPGIGILISEIVLNFNLEELKIQSGMTDKPLIQGVFFNSKSKRWQQCLIKLM